MGKWMKILLGNHPAEIAGKDGTGQSETQNDRSGQEKSGKINKMPDVCANESTFLFYFAGLFKKGIGPVAQLDRATAF